MHWCAHEDAGFKVLMIWMLDKGSCEFRATSEMEKNGEEVGCFAMPEAGSNLRIRKCGE